MLNVISFLSFFEGCFLLLFSPGKILNRNQRSKILWHEIWMAAQVSIAGIEKKILFQFMARHH